MKKKNDEEELVFINDKLDDSEEKTLDEKINDYLNERLVYLIGFANVSDGVINDIVKLKDYNYVVDMMKSMHNFLNKNKNKLPVEVSQNFVKFVNNPNIRFHEKYKTKEANKIINDIIECSNTATFTDYSFFINEVPKFYDFDQNGELYSDNIDKLIELEESVYEYLVDALFAKDDEFIEKYFFGDQGVGTLDNLYVINYLTNDFPTVFKDQTFLERTSTIISVNRKLTNTKGVVIHLLSERTLGDKIKCMLYLKSFKKKNDGLARHVINGFNRS